MILIKISVIPHPSCGIPETLFSCSISSKVCTKWLTLIFATFVDKINFKRALCLMRPLTWQSFHRISCWRKKKQHFKDSLAATQLIHYKMFHFFFLDKNLNIKMAVCTVEHSPTPPLPYTHTHPPLKNSPK